MAGFVSVFKSFSYNTYSNNFLILTIISVCSIIDNVINKCKYFYTKWNQVYVIV